MNPTLSLKGHTIESLIELGTQGHFPLFHSSWIQEIYTNNSRKLTVKERKKTKEIIQKLSKHQSLDRKKTVLFSLNNEERRLFIQAFLKMVEAKILNQKPELH